MSLKEKAILVSLNITKPQQQRKDREATQETALRHAATESAVAVVKRLYPKHLMDPIVSAEMSARRYMESVTAPWARGLNLLPSILFFPFTEKIGEHKLKFEQEVTVFLNNAVDVLQQAAHEQGDLYDQSNYPDLRTLRSQFRFNVAYYPLGTESDVVLKLEEKSLNELREQVAEQTKTALVESARAVHQRLFEAVQRIHTQCSKENGKIYDSLTGGLDELLIVLPQLDMTENQNFAAVCREARQSLVVAPEALRTVPGVREKTAQEAERIMNTMKAFMGQ